MSILYILCIILLKKLIFTFFVNKGGDESKFKKPKIQNLTRWSSLYNMLDIFLRLK